MAPRRLGYFGAMVLALSCSFSTAETQVRPGQQRALEGLRDQIGQLQARQEAVRNRHRALRSDLEGCERRIADLARANFQLGLMREEQEAAVAVLAMERDSQHRRLEQLRQALVGHLRLAYAAGRQERLKLLLNQEDPILLSRVVAYFGYLTRDRAQRIEAMKRTVRQLEEVGRAFEDERARLAEIRARQTQQRAGLGREQLQRQGLLTELEQVLQDQHRRLSELRQDAESLQRLIERLEDPAGMPAGPQHFSRRRGQLPWPLSGPVARRFGTTKESGLRWDGILIAVAAGQPVVAVHDGRVAFADWLRGFGLLLILDHGDGYMTLYGHNQALLKEVGEWVEVEDPVALSGGSGGQSDPGLYFAIRHQGKPVDPHQWLARRPPA